MIFDSHAHYDDERFDGIRDDVIRDVHNNGVARITNVSSNLGSAKSCIELSQKFDFVYAALGVHPDSLSDMENKDWLDILEEGYKAEKVVAIGEIGLDYYYGAEQKEEQKKCFREQMRLAQKIGAPVIIHDREAHEDTLNIIKEFPDVFGVVHSFSGSFEFAREVMKLGYYISVNGVVTFKNAKKIVDIITRLRDVHEDALSRLLVETDCPYLAPVPYRGKTNRSDYIENTAEKCAQLLEISREEFCTLTYNNACRFYGLEVKK